jgi:DNA-binding transcriptional regulator YiaG
MPPQTQRTRQRASDLTGADVQRLREHAGLSQHELASSMDISEASLRKIETQPDRCTTSKPLARLLAFVIYAQTRAALPRAIEHREKILREPHNTP